MINCVSMSVPPARSNCTGAQLVYGVRGGHTIHTIISKLVSRITHFADRFIQCRQNTVVSLMGSIQHCILGITGRIFYTPVDENTYSDRIINTKRNERCNIHDNLAQVRKSEKSLQYSDWSKMIEASMCDNCDNINYNFYQKFGKSDHTTSTHMTYGRDYCTIKTSGIIVLMMIFLILCAPISLSFMPTIFFIN